MFAHVTAPLYCRFSRVVKEPFFCGWHRRVEIISFSDSNEATMPGEKRKIMETPESSTTTKRCRKCQNDDQLTDHREEFLRLAEQQADAAMITAEAIRSLAETAKQQTAILKKLVTLVSKLVPDYLEE